MESPGALRTPPGRRTAPVDVQGRADVDTALDAPPTLTPARSTSTRRHLRTQASGKAAIVVAILATAMWLVANNQALVTLAMGLVFAVVADGWLARRALPRELHLEPVGAAGHRAARWRGGSGPTASRPVTVRPAGQRKARPLLFDRAEGDDLVLPATPRGVVHVVDLDLLASGPIGLCRAARRYRIAPERPRVVGPRATEERVVWPPPAGISVDLTQPTPRGDDLFRGVRPYQRGDERRKVHWKASARMGEMMVREEEGTGFVTLQVVLELPPAPPTIDGIGAPDPAVDPAEGAVALAAAVVEAGRHEGWAVQLVTLDATPGPPEPISLGTPWRRLPSRLRTPGVDGAPAPVEQTVAQLVAGHEAVIRQLATAVPGRPSAPPWAGLRCRISTDGIEWS